MREEHLQKRTERIRFRITPACAGRTDNVVSFSNHLQDHPRVCGKNQEKGVKCREIEGSPPRVREELLTSMLICTLSGITPACAGRTFKSRCEMGFT